MSLRNQDQKSRSWLKHQLKRAMNHALTSAVEQSHVKNYLLASKTNNGTLILGKYVIVKNHNQTHTVFDHNQHALYENLYLFEAALAIVENLNRNQKHFAEQVVDLEQRYCQLYIELELLRQAAQHNSCLWSRVDVVKEKLDCVKNKIFGFVSVQNF